jgi:hypothetical protein
MLPFVSRQRFGFVIKPSLCFENYRSASETRFVSYQVSLAVPQAPSDSKAL